MTDYDELTDWDWQLAILREAEHRFEREEQKGTDEGSRKLIACNVLVAYYHLSQEESPHRDEIGLRELRTVTIARFFNDELVIRWRM